MKTVPSQLQLKDLASLALIRESGPRCPPPDYPPCLNAGRVVLFRRPAPIQRGAAILIPLPRSWNLPARSHPTLILWHFRATCRHGRAILVKVNPTVSCCQLHPPHGPLKQPWRFAVTL